MIEKIKYVNHLNEEVVFGQSPFFAMENDLRDFAYEVNTINGLKFTRGEVVKTLPIKLINATPEQKNYLYNIIQKDILNEVYGTIWIGDYYYKCNIYSSVKELYTDISELRIELKAYTKINTWCKELMTVFKKSSGSDETPDNAKAGYPYCYPYGYARTNQNEIVSNTFGYPCSFKITIYGPVINPVVTVGGHVYKVSCTVLDGEYLTVLSTGIDKLIYITQNDGTQINKFAKRDKTSYIFEKIKNGNSIVAWDNTFDFDITLIDERGEPEWT